MKLYGNTKCGLWVLGADRQNCLLTEGETWQWNQLQETWMSNCPDAAKCISQEEITQERAWQWGVWVCYKPGTIRELAISHGRSHVWNSRSSFVTGASIFTPIDLHSEKQHGDTEGFWSGKKYLLCDPDYSDWTEPCLDYANIQV